LFRLDGLVSIADKTLLMALVGALFVWGLTLERYAWATVLSAVFTLGLATLFVGRSVGRTAPQFAQDGIRSLLWRSFPFAMVIVLFSIHDRANQVLLERMASPHELGLYSAAYRWFAAVQMYLWTILPVFYAKFAAAEHQPQSERQSLFQTGWLLTALPMAWVAAAFWFDGHRLFFLLGASTPTEIIAITHQLRILALALLALGGFNVFSTWLTATGLERAASSGLAVAIGVNLAVTALLVPIMGGAGAAWALVASYATQALAYVWVLHRKASIQVPWRLGLGLASLVGVMWLAYAALISVLGLLPPPSDAWVTGLYAAIPPVASLLLLALGGWRIWRHHMVS
jgi:O-antigen/teichoic acid export membrane protein